jgi:lysozyme family protein
MDDFTMSFAHVLATEGGYVNDPKDPGGPTNHGVTQKEYDAWRTAHGQPVQSVRNIDTNEVEMMYRKWFWTPCGADRLPPGVDYCVFDCAVNSGPHKAVTLLQQAVGATPDGSIGPKTLAAVKAGDPARIVNTFCDERLAFLQSLPGWAHDGRGWSNRVASVRITSRAMVTTPTK